jgi:hypothetical protein
VRACLGTWTGPRTAAGAEKVETFKLGLLDAVLDESKAPR